MRFHGGGDVRLWALAASPSYKSWRPENLIYFPEEATPRRVEKGVARAAPKPGAPARATNEQPFASSLCMSSCGPITGGAS